MLRTNRIKVMENHRPHYVGRVLAVSHRTWLQRLMDNPHVSLAADTIITSAAVILPSWAYTVSAWAGFVTMILGLGVVSLRLAIAYRDWRAGVRIRDEDINERP